MVLEAKKTRRENPAKTQALEAVAQEGIKRLNVDIPERLHRQLKTRAAAEGTTIRVLTKKVLEEYLKE